MFPSKPFINLAQRKGKPRKQKKEVEQDNLLLSLNRREEKRWLQRVTRGDVFE